MVTGDARITNMANKTEHMELDKKKHPALPSAHPPAAAGPCSPHFFKKKLIFESAVLSVLFFINRYRIYNSAGRLIDTY